MGNKVSLEDEMINLRIVSKQMQRSAKKCEKNEKAALEKLKKVRNRMHHTTLDLYSSRVLFPSLATRNGLRRVSVFLSFYLRDYPSTILRFLSFSFFITIEHSTG
jgi:charged multivesicular body protein 1